MTLRRSFSFGRVAAWLLTIVFVAVTALFASPGVKPALAACSVTDPASCVSSVADCLDPPTPAMPDTGASSFFLKAPDVSPDSVAVGVNSSLTYYKYGYAGLQYHTYDLGCGPDGAVAPDALVNTSVANIMFGVATFIVGLTNSVREHAFDPKQMWGWTDGLVARASEALYQRIFTTLGIISVIIVGAWLLWSARRGDMSDAATTAGWAVLVLVVTTAIAAWPARSASVADNALTGSLGIVNEALHPSSKTKCGDFVCESAPPATQASATVTDVVLYKQWLSGELGSSDSKTAEAYGDELLDASTFSWKEGDGIRSNPAQRTAAVKAKQDAWQKDAADIKKTDPDAYEYLTGKQGTARIGSGFTALIAALAVAPFDLISSTLIIIAFLIIRLAVVFLPAIAVVGILRPASGPLRGLFRTVVAAVINCVIFGVGASVYLLAVELITGTASLAGWQQILLIFLTGLVMWMLLRPFRRLTSLAGGNPFHDMVGGLTAIRRRAFDGAREAAIVAAGAVVGSKVAEDDSAKGRGETRPETWTRDTTVVRVDDAPPVASRGSSAPDESPVSAGLAAARAASTPSRGMGAEDPVPSRAPQRVPALTSRPESGAGIDYRDPSYAVSTRGETLPVQSDERFVVYRPDSGFKTVEPESRPENRAPINRPVTVRDEMPPGGRPEARAEVVGSRPE